MCAPNGCPTFNRKHVEWPTVLIICSAMPGKGMSSWHKWRLEMSLSVIILNQNQNYKVSSGSIQGHYHQKKSKAIHTSAGKIMLTFFFDQDGTLLIPAVRDNSKCPVLLANLDHPLSGDQIKTYRQAHPWDHSASWQCKASYSQHDHGSIQSRPLSLRLCHFLPLKKALRGKWFTSDDNAKQCERNWFTTQPREFYETAIHRLVSQWDKCLTSQGQYFWHTGTDFCS